MSGTHKAHLSIQRNDTKRFNFIEIMESILLFGVFFFFLKSLKGKFEELKVSDVAMLGVGLGCILAQF